jgi:BolA protein
LNPTAAQIEARLQKRLAPSRLEITDDSAKHVGHAGAASGGGHFSCLIVAEAFRGRSTLERHRAVYEALADLMKRDIHALALRTFAPGETVR